MKNVKKILMVGLAILILLGSTYNIGYSETNWALDKIDIDEAWKITKGSDNVTVAVIDSGIDIENGEFDNNIISPYNAMDDSTNIEDKNGHGTNIAGIIGASDNGRGITGVAPDVNIMPIKIFDTIADIKDLIKAIEYACENGADIVNCSVTIEPEKDNRYTIDFENWKLVDNYYEYYKNHDLKKVIEKYSDVLFVFPSGNQFKSNSFFPALYDLDNIISVAATNEKDRLWFEFGLNIKGSNYGKKSVDLGAPGKNTLSIGLNGLEYKTGTSIATAYTTGVAALVKSEYPNMTSLEIKEVIINSVSFSKKLKNKVLSSGVLNAKNALDYAKKYYKKITD